jgi:hypothetical protein
MGPIATPMGYWAFFEASAEGMRQMQRSDSGGSVS